MDVVSKQKVCIVGIYGQDGSILGNLFQKKNWNVFGLYKNQSTIHNVNSLITKIKCDTTNFRELQNTFSKIKPDLIINVSGIPGNFETLKKIEIQNPDLLVEVTKTIPLNILNWIHENPKTRFITALSSLMYSPEKMPEIINADTPINPQGLYGELKASVYEVLKSFRKSRDVQIFGAILFTHTSHLEVKNFLIQNLTNNLKNLAKGTLQNYSVKYPDQPIDIGNAFDYCECIYKFGVKTNLNSCNFIVASGKPITLRLLINHLESQIGKNFVDKITFVGESVVYPYLMGNITHTKQLVNWEPKIGILKTLMNIYNQS